MLFLSEACDCYPRQQQQREEKKVPSCLALFAAYFLFGLLTPRNSVDVHFWEMEGSVLRVREKLPHSSLWLVSLFHNFISSTLLFLGTHSPKFVANFLESC